MAARMKREVADLSILRLPDKGNYISTRQRFKGLKDLRSSAAVTSERLLWALERAAAETILLLYP